ncbi:hypothetical protein RMCBS344292_06917 [Rhizopus microsporus]|nr:hypothetical protein RMCBS344292_06917 [Rhizopus microsporus]
MAYNASLFDVNRILKSQQLIEDGIQLESSLLQICINVIFSFTVLLIFCIIRPKYPVIYESKRTLCKSETQRPDALGKGWFSWIKPTFNIKDDTLIQYSRLDAFTFIYFVRMLKRLIIIMTIGSMAILLPVNIVTALNTGDWPPASILGFITTPSFYTSDQSDKSKIWYWCPTIAIWLYSILIVGHMIMASRSFLRLRKKYHTMLTKDSHRIEDAVSRTLLLYVNEPSKTTIEWDKIKCLVHQFSNTPSQRIATGSYNQHLTYLVQKYTSIVNKLEKSLVAYLSKVKKDQNDDGAAEELDTFKRPIIKLGWWHQIKVDAIDYYTDQALTLSQSIKRNRNQLQNADHLFAIYADTYSAHQAYVSLLDKTTEQHALIQKVALAPHPKDIIWKNMTLDHDTRKLKRLFGHGLFLSSVFLASFPIAIVASLSNLINILRFFHKTRRTIANNRVILGVIQSYFTPWFMFFLFLISISLLRYITQQQGYRTKSMLEQKTLIRVFAFFVIDYLFIFTVFGVLIGILGQMTIMARLLHRERTTMLSRYVFQMGKNIIGICIHWINYICINCVGLAFQLLRPLALIKDKQDVSDFDFTKNYAMVLSIFVATLFSSAIVPIILPFALLYFGFATMVFKYELMYVYTVKVDTYGKTWPVLYCIILCSVIAFQLMMILVLSLKGALFQVYSLIPLPLLTCFPLVLHGKYLYRKIHPLQLELNNDDNDSTEPKEINNPTPNDDRSARWIEKIYRDPVIRRPLIKPCIPEEYRLLIPQVYKHHRQHQLILKELFQMKSRKKSSRTNTINTTRKSKEEESERVYYVDPIDSYYDGPSSSSNSTEPSAPDLEMILAESPLPAYVSPKEQTL